MSEKSARLKQPFAPGDIKWRLGWVNPDKTKGRALAYIDARHVMDRLDEVVGAENWQSSFHEVCGRVVCRLGVNFQEDNAGICWKEDGAGDTQIEPEKGGLSDAFKRAGVHFGIGRYLYEMDSPIVAVKNKQIAKHEFLRLAELLSTGKDPGASQPLPEDRPEPAPRVAPPSVAEAQTTPEGVFDVKAAMKEFRIYSRIFKLAEAEFGEDTKKFFYLDKALEPMDIDSVKQIKDMATMERLDAEVAALEENA